MWGKPLDLALCLWNGELRCFGVMYLKICKAFRMERKSFLRVANSYWVFVVYFFGKYNVIFEIFMKLVFASDSFKGTLTSSAIHRILTEIAKEYFSNVDCVSVSLGDGGEGTVEALSRQLSGKWHVVQVRNPLGDSINARFFMLDDQTAVMEMAEASGFSLINHSPVLLMQASTYGTGELIKAALAQGARKIIIGIGGSATNDGGLGALCALGYRFYDQNEKLLKGIASDLSRVERIDTRNVDPLLKSVPIIVMSDVDNPLIGPNGATYTYGPQKGADNIALDALESGMRHFLEISQHQLEKAEDFKGAGAAGGLGYALKVFFGAQLNSGIETVLSLVDFDRKIEGAQAVITGEGRLDWQSVHGKVISGVLKHANEKSIPVFAIVGQKGPGADEMFRLGLKSVIEVSEFAPDLKSAMTDAAKYYRLAARHQFKLLKEQRHS